MTTSMILASFVFRLAAAVAADPTLAECASPREFGDALRARFESAARAARGVNKYNANARYYRFAPEHEHTDAIHDEWEFWSRTWEAWQVLRLLQNDGEIYDTVEATVARERHPFDGSEPLWLNIYTQHGHARSRDLHIRI